MRYCSTRGGIEPVSFSQAVMMGLATDGGLLLPGVLPANRCRYPQALGGPVLGELAVEVMLPYGGDDIGRDALQGLVERSLRLHPPEVTPLVKVGDRQILELFHGPTAAFKDVALQFLGNLFEFLLQRDGGQLNILGATSGDTGSAAIYGVRGKAGIHIFILHPHNRVSPIQERQMTTVLDANVHNIAIQGNFDDGQRIVKALFNDLEFKQAYRLGAVNSINWMRILAQVVYYFYELGLLQPAAIRPTRSVADLNFGDIFAGYVALRMGLPVERLILATNRNDILSRFVNTGVYAARSVHHTISPSMDIQISSNFERYLYYLLDQDPAQVRELMGSTAQAGRIEVATDKQQQAARASMPQAVSEVETLEQIKHTYQMNGHIWTRTPQSESGRRGSSPVPSAWPPPIRPSSVRRSSRPSGWRCPSSSLQGLMEKETRCALLEVDTLVVKRFMQDTLAGARD